jgi:hypothetical protein
MDEQMSPPPDASDTSRSGELPVASALLDRVATLEAENAWLRQRFGETSFVETFGKALREAALAGTIADPVPHLLAVSDMRLDIGGVSYTAHRSVVGTW